MSPEFTRREVIKLGGLAAAAAAVGALPPAARALVQPPGAPARSRVLRLAHLTDMHVQPERRAGEGLAACLRHVQSLADKPQLVMTGGDLVMDSMGQDRARTKIQWDLWKKVLRDECSLPLEHCIGNHDVWGWDKKKSGTTGDELDYGKKWAMEMIGVARPYRTFERAGWKFIVLDSIFPKDAGYTARLDDEQIAWLTSELAAADPKANILVVSHIPILAACPFYMDQAEKSGDWKVQGALMHLDSRAIKNLFLKHPNVRACLSGHIHLVDRVDYNGVRYFCDGAVCGNWWKGAHQECREGYATIDLYDDGTVEREYHEYGWTAAPK